MEPSPALAIDALVKRYGELVAVDGISFDVARGTCLGLLGPNGAGKTTTVEILEGLRQPDGGTVRVLGMQWRDRPRQIRRRIGVQLQQTRFQEKLTVSETMAMFASFYPDPLPLDEVLTLVGLQSKARARIKTLSGGQAQRVALGAALIGRPELLFLDEPTTGLDPQARRQVWEVIASFKRQGKTVLLTTHYMDEAERLADALLIIDRGKIIARGSPRRIIDQLGADNVIEVTPAEPHDTRWPDQSQLLGLPGVIEIQSVASRLRLSVRQTSLALPALLALLEGAEIAVADLHTHRPTLEDVFVRLTGRRLRDG